MRRNRPRTGAVTQTVLLLLAAHTLRAPEILILVLDARALRDSQRRRTTTG
jgi:hypothetical protein